MTVKVSFVLPAYNVATKMAGCLKSLDNLHEEMESIEAVFVDDVSTDATFSQLKSWAEARPWVKVVQLEENSGSPSRPRNVGARMARGEYVYFLDPDDELVVEGFLAGFDLAQKKQADIVRSPLFRFDGTETVVMNQIPNWSENFSRAERVQAIFANQSTNPPGLVRKSLLDANEIIWPNDLRMGEDSVFLAHAMLAAKAIEYNEHPDFIYNAEVVTGSTSSTQQYNDRELLNHVEVWRRVSEALGKIGVDYFVIRGQVALQAVFQSLIKFNNGGISHESFLALQKILVSHQKAVENYDFNDRLSELRKLIFTSDFDAFLEAIKSRLLIAGFDLKFILPALPALKENFQVKIDEWVGHDRHDKRKSQDLLEWAEVIHCEWLLGNAVWYSKNKLPGQILIIRAHRFELTRQFGLEINLSKVDRIIGVSVHTLEDFIGRFNLPREKCRLIPNYVETDAYSTSENPQRVFNLALIGSVPSLKGYRRAIELLAALRAIDERYNLTVFGKLPAELPWVMNNPQEQKYFEDCDMRIEELELSSSISFPGWVNTKTALSEMGIVLSLSDLESFHVAPAEAFAAGNIAFLLPWQGAEYIYPSEFICRNLTEMRDSILECRDSVTHSELAQRGKEFITARYSLQRFGALYRNVVQSV